jgi:hypothetical protein
MIQPTLNTLKASELRNHIPWCWPAGYLLLLLLLLLLPVGC